MATEDQLRATFAVRLQAAVNKHEARHGVVSTVELAVQMDLGENTLAYLIKGERLPSLPVLLKIATFLDVKMSWLLGE
jgi:transcriptional regulator with XRE-family HTH domain